MSTLNSSQRNLLSRITKANNDLKYYGRIVLEESSAAMNDIDMRTNVRDISVSAAIYFSLARGRMQSLIDFAYTNGIFESISDDEIYALIQEALK